MLNTVYKEQRFTPDHIKRFVLAGRSKDVPEKLTIDTLKILADLLNGCENLDYIRDEVIYWNEGLHNQIKLDNSSDRFKDDKKGICADKWKPFSLDIYLDEHAINIRSERLSNG